jgi:hypothetical protein
MKVKKPCKPGRFTRPCVRCKNEFRTHSSNRDVCHKCLPKCREIHHFKGTPVAGAKSARKSERPPEASEA